MASLRNKRYPNTKGISLAKALEIGVTRLAEAEPIEVQICAYRKKARLGKKEMERIENFTAISPRDRIRLEEALGTAEDAVLASR